MRGKYTKALIVCTRGGHTTVADSAPYRTLGGAKSELMEMGGMGLGHTSSGWVYRKSREDSSFVLK